MDLGPFKASSPKIILAPILSRLIIYTFIYNAPIPDSFESSSIESDLNPYPFGLFGCPHIF